MLIAPPNCGVLIPIPQCPLYTATIAQFSGTTVPYYLDETSGWSTSVKSVEAAIEKATSKGVTTKVLVIINPGNPTGALLDQETQARLVELCEKHSLILLADEVYQDNLRRRDTSPFTSFKKVVAQTQSPIPLVSFHSISKGVSGECGRRGGYFECTNISDGVIAQMYKMVSFGWSSPLLGQIGVNCMVRPPKAGDESYPLWKKETREIHEALAARNRTQLMVARLNSLPGVSCVDSLGTLYLHPRIELSESAISAARAAGKEPDAFYSLELLDQTGICVTPGSGFGQKENNWHYRLTCLCPGIEEYVSKLEAFHKSFLEKYCA
ncbi:hypothetical protein DXG01_012856 [Tephrocybe rancida]|nr:hypothetical protein DXG01_012856 [Tephrocybe rancida]